MGLPNRLCFDSKYAKIALVVHYLSWSNMFLMTRTLSNSLEAQCVIIAAYYLFTRNKLWMKYEPYRSGHWYSLHVAMVVMVISVWIRPTIALIWVSTCCL